MHAACYLFKSVTQKQHYHPYLLTFVTLRLSSIKLNKKYNFQKSVHEFLTHSL